MLDADLTNRQSKNFIVVVPNYGAPIVCLFHMLNICSIYAEYSFYISNICSVLQCLFHILNIYSIFQIFIPNLKYLFNIPKICVIFQISVVLKWLPSLFCTSISVL